MAVLAKVGGFEAAGLEVSGSIRDVVTIKPLPRLKPLPVLEGFVPKGWKDAIYEFD